MNYTIWPLYAESVSFPINAKLFWARQLQSIKQLGARALQSIKKLGEGALKSIKQLGVRTLQSIKQLGCAHIPINRQFAQSLE
jgi:hypothetical protein